MGEILGVGCTHRPVMLRRNEDWTVMMKASLDDPAMPDKMKNPARWPAPLRAELGNDWGTSAAARAREVYRRHFAEARRALDEFKPDGSTRPLHPRCAARGLGVLLHPVHGSRRSRDVERRR